VRRSSGFARLRALNDQEGAISEMAEIWDPEIELMSQRPLGWASVESAEGLRRSKNGGESGLPPGKPSSLSTSWLAAATA
jgi:hypothetical protein